MWPYRLLMLLMRAMWCSVRRIRGVVCRGWRRVEALGQYESWLWWWAWILLCSHRGCGTLRVWDVAETSRIWLWKHLCLHGTDFEMFVAIFYLFAFMLFMRLHHWREALTLCYGNRKNTMLSRTERVMSFWSPVNDFLIFSSASAWPYFSIWL